MQKSPFGDTPVSFQSASPFGDTPVSGGFVANTPEPQERGGPSNAMAMGLPFADEVAAYTANRFGELAPESFGGFPKQDLQTLDDGRVDISGLRGSFGAVLPEVEPNFQGGYEDIRQGINQNTDAYVADNPKKAIALALGTGLGTGGLGGIKAINALTKGKGLKEKVAAASGVAAVEGGIYGAGEAEPGQRAEGAGQGAFIGGALGPAGLGASHAVGGVIRGAGRGIKNTKDFLSPATAEEQVRKAIDNDAVDDVGQAVADVGPSGILADVGPNSRALLDTSAGFQGPAKKQINDFLDNRNLGRNERVTSATYNELGDADEFLSDIDNVIAQRAQDSTPLYTKAYETPIKINKQIEGILETDAGKKALKHAERLASNAQIELPPMEDGIMSTQMVDFIQRALSDKTTNKKIRGGKHESMLMGNLGRMLKAAADKQNPDFAAARNAYAGPSRMIEAAENGRKFFNEDSFLSAKALKSLSDSEQEFFFKGAAKAVRDKILSAQDGADAYKRIFGNQLTRERIKAVMPDDESFNRFSKAMEQESTMAATRARVQGNSLTSERQLAADDFNNAREAGRAVARGDMIGAAISGIREALKRKNVGNSERAQEIADILLTSDPATIKRIMSLQKGMRGKNAQIMADALALSASNKAAVLSQQER